MADDDDDDAKALRDALKEVKVRAKDIEAIANFAFVKQFRRGAITIIFMGHFIIYVNNVNVYSL